MLNPNEAIGTWVKFANLCRKSERMFLAEKTINSLSLADDVSAAEMSFEWAVDRSLARTAARHILSPEVSVG